MVGWLVHRVRRSQRSGKPDDVRVRGGGDLVGGWAGGGKLELVKRLKNSFVEVSYRWYTTLWDFLRLEFYLGAQVAGGFGVVKVDPGGVVLVLQFDPEFS